MSELFDKSIRTLELPRVLQLLADQAVSEDPWNLMCSGYPRSLTLRINALALYHETVVSPDDLAVYVHRIAKLVTGALDEVAARPSLYAGDLEKAERVYSWFVKSCGGGFENVMAPERIQAILKEKAESGLLS